LWDAAKTVLKGKFVALTASIRKQSLLFGVYRKTGLQTLAVDIVRAYSNSNKGLLFLSLLAKIKSSIWADRAAQVAEHLPSKCQALSSNPSTAKKKKKKYVFLPV
jgi:hypothetical protein